jgi:hypothetical protein
MSSHLLAEFIIAYHEVPNGRLRKRMAGGRTAASELEHSPKFPSTGIPLRLPAPRLGHAKPTAASSRCSAQRWRKGGGTSLKPVRALIDKVITSRRGRM